MATYYVGAGGNDGNNGTNWALRKLTLNGAEDIPVAANDTVYVGPGTYREMLTCDVSGNAGTGISYIGDYTGANTDGVGGLVRITGSDNDQTATRASCVTCAAQRNYRTFRGFLMDTTTGSQITGGTTAGTNWVIDKCALMFGSGGGGGSIYVAGANQLAWAISNCYLAFPDTQGKCIVFTHSSTVDNTGHVVSNCRIMGQGHANSAGVQVVRVGGITVKNSTIGPVRMGIGIGTALAAGQTLTVNNCIVQGCDLALYAVAADGSFVENYNALFVNSTARTNVNVGANSNAFPALFEMRWFFEAVNGGRMITPFDLASYSKLVGVAGTSPTTTDMRGTAAIGGVREWGALEYDATLAIEAGTAGGMLQSNKRGNKQ